MLGIQKPEASATLITATRSPFSDFQSRAASLFYAKKKPILRDYLRMGIKNWRRPTLTGPIVQLPSAQKRFTSGFGMGPGGSTLLWSPDFRRESGRLKFKGKRLKFLTSNVLESADICRHKLCFGCCFFWLLLERLLPVR